MTPEEQAIIDAFIIEGPVPEFHQMAVNELRTGWPTLYSAVTRLVAARRGRRSYTVEREALAALLNQHHPTRGMSVASGVTCSCGYWTGSEPDTGKRPLPWGLDRLDLHRADVLAALIEARR